jgi:sulfatase modifying factor 1
MAYHHTLSRREFLRLVGLTASATVLNACSSQTPAVIAPTATVAPPQPAPTEVKPTATATKPPPTPTRETKPILPEMVLVEAGSFQMGSADGPSDERPVHLVRITRPFHVAKYEVTFEEYDRFCNDTVGHKKPEDRGWGRGKQPVMGVGWNDALAYCNWLSGKEGLTPCYSGKGILTRCDFTANGYRLPTEVEWEYAARGGNKSKECKYAGSNNADEVAWYANTSGGQTQIVGQKQPNELGLYDMSGNAFEWCWDLYDGEYYATSPADDPAGPLAPPQGEAPDPRGPNRVRRSGNWRESSDSVRVTCRSADFAGYPGENGFRLAKTKTA